MVTQARVDVDVVLVEDEDEDVDVELGADVAAKPMSFLRACLAPSVQAEMAARGRGAATNRRHHPRGRATRQS